MDLFIVLGVICCLCYDCLRLCLIRLLVSLVFCRFALAVVFGGRWYVLFV